jgi:hypothetical protein
VLDAHAGGRIVRNERASAAGVKPLPSTTRPLTLMARTRVAPAVGHSERLGHLVLADCRLEPQAASVTGSSRTRLMSAL